MDEHSDIEILVDLESAHSLLDLGGFLYNLQELLGVEIDVVTERGLRTRNRQRVLKEAMPLWEELTSIYLNLTNKLWDRLIGVTSLGRVIGNGQFYLTPTDA